MTSDATRAQNTASRPESSTWVAANAGSGKTRVLTDRVARLLLAGNAPQKILCLTYTKAAAAEMQNRLFGRLGEWAMMSDADLREALSGIGENGENYSDAALRNTRTHFARALETPGGLKIQTIHAFCASILRRFPIEAGVSPQFREMDDGEAAALRASVLESLAGESESEAFGALTRHLSDEFGLDKFLLDILKHKSDFGGFDRNVFAKMLGVDPEATEASILEDAMIRLPIALLTRVRTALASSEGVKDNNAGDGLAGVEDAADLSALMAQLQSVFLTAEMKPRASRGFPTAGLAKQEPWIGEAMEDIKQTVFDVYQATLGIAALNQTQDLHRFADAFITDYEAQKAVRGLLDFDDLIDRTRALLSDREMTAWVLYRLDAGIDHVLVDEAQDTSPKQWEVIEALTAEFTDGASASDKTRTLFVVGDKKQSIFGFQGADPNEFVRMQVGFAAKFAEARMSLGEVPLETSFRSAAPILQLVDQVFADDTGALDGPPTHRFLPEFPGRVDVWPFKPTPEKMDEPPWFEPVDTVAGNDPVNALAQEVADHIAQLIKEGVSIPCKEGWRAVTAGDFLILVRSRSRFFLNVIDGLKSRGVPVAGADRLMIGQELAVRDIVSLLRFLDNELDDMSLAEALRSPLFGLSEQDLFTLAHARDGSLWARFIASEHVEAVDMLKELRDGVGFLRPYEIMTKILAKFGGRKNFRARLGAECEEAIDELLAQSLIYETSEAPTLGGFLFWLNARDIVVKRDMEAGRDEVRVMTVHGAKGLEAPIVILPDTTELKAGQKKPAVALYDGTPFWTQTKKQQFSAFEEVEEARKHKETNEYARLLYVALTRAERWLIVCGAGQRSEKNARRWYNRVSAAMEALGAKTVEEHGRQIERIDYNWNDSVLPGKSAPVSDEPAVSWMRTAPAVYERVPKPIAPSDFPGGHALPGESGGDSETAKRRGEVIHALLELLPQRNRAEWQEITVKKCGSDFDAEEILAEVAGVISAPDLAHVFADDVLVEVAIAADLPAHGRRISGRIDRLVVRPDEVLAIDFKSNQVIPENPEETPSALLAQMGAYATALSQIYPDRTIKTAIIWTKTATFMELPHVSVMNAVKAVTLP